MTSGVSVKKYYEEINIARGIAVLLVLIGHSFPRVSAGNNPGVAESFIVNFVYYFHMALFMFLSGFVSSRKMYSPNTRVGSDVLKSAKRLIVPYLLYSLVTFFLKQAFSSYANRQFSASELWTILLGSNPNGGLWYLWTLFVLSACVLLFSRLIRKDAAFLFFGVLLQIIYFMVPMGFLTNLSRMAVFFLAGVVASRHYDAASVKYMEFIKNRPATICLPITALAMIATVAWLSIGNSVQMSIYPFTAALGIYACLDISLRITKKGKFVKRLYGVLGDYSYDLYLLAYFVQIPIRVVGYDMLGLPYASVVVAMLGLGLLIPYTVSRFVIRRFRILSGIMLGRWG